MTGDQTIATNQAQRIQIELETGPAKCLQICLENFDEKLGWYISGSLSLPLHQLPLLEQALAGMRCANCVNEPACIKNKIIRFPGLVDEAAANSVSEMV